MPKKQEVFALENCEWNVEIKSSNGRSHPTYWWEATTENNPGFSTESFEMRGTKFSKAKVKEDWEQFAGLNNFLYWRYVE